MKEQTIVGFNFREEVLWNKKDILIMMYNSKDQPICWKHKELWNQWAAEHQDENWHLVWGQFDYGLNEVEHIKPTHFPTVVVFPGKDKEMWHTYEGEYTFEAVMAWANPLLSYRPFKTEL